MPATVLGLVALLGAASALAVLAINAREIDRSLARGLDHNDRGHEYRKRPSALSVIFDCKPLLTFTAAITLFHFADAAELPLVGERLSQGQKDSGSLFHNGLHHCGAGRYDTDGDAGWRQERPWGRKLLFLLGLVIVQAGQCRADGATAALDRIAAGRYLGCRRSLDIVFGEIDR